GVRDAVLPDLAVGGDVLAAALGRDGRFRGGGERPSRSGAGLRPGVDPGPDSQRPRPGRLVLRVAGPAAGRSRDRPRFRGVAGGRARARVSGTEAAPDPDRRDPRAPGDDVPAVPGSGAAAKVGVAKAKAVDAYQARVRDSV